MLALVFLALAQTPVATDAPPTTTTTTETAAPTTTPVSAPDERAVQAMERTAAAAERTAAAAEKLAQQGAAQNAAAGVTPAADDAAAQGWTGSVGLGFVSLTGNAEALTLTGLVALERKWEDWIVRVRSTGAYGQARTAATAGTDAEVVALRALGELRGDRRFGERATGFLMVGADTDHVRSVEARYYGEAGASMLWLDQKAEDFDRLSLRTDVAFRVVNEMRFQYYPVPMDVPDVFLAGPRFGVAFRYGLSKDTTFAQDAEVIPDILGGGRVLFNSTTKLSTKLTRSLSMGVSFLVTHDSVPAVGKLTTDTALTAGIDLAL